MKVTMTLWDVHQQIESILKQRELTKGMIAHCVIEDRDCLDKFVNEHQLFEELLENLCGIEVTYDNGFGIKEGYKPRFTE